ncbi:alkaline phosphatase [Marinifilum sp. JC120]|nr:alkaline phosphatase [Marinifilum sp. JC120]
MKKTFIALLCAASLTATAGICSAAGIKLVKAGTYHTGAFDESAAEIVSFDPASMQAFVVNGDSKAIDILNISNVNKPALVDSISVKKYGKGANSVAVKKGLVAAAVEATPKQNTGKIVVMNTAGDVKAVFPAGALPDMVTFTPDGKHIISANEGEPNDKYDNDPEGSVTIINISKGLKKAVVKQVRFDGYNSKKTELQKKGVRISHPKATVAQDLEPEYLAVSPDSKTVFVSLQENNAIAVIDIASGKIKDIFPLGLKDWAAHKNVFDASNKDGGIMLKSWQVFGCYMPDSIASYKAGGKTYIVTANEGDGREYGEDDDHISYVDEVRAGKAKLDAKAFPNAAELQEKKNLGRLKVIKDLSDTDGDGDLDRLVAFGARSFSIYSEDGKLVYDSGDDFEKITAKTVPEGFNASNDDNEMDDRSDDKGPEPEGVTVGEIDGRAYAFVGLERIGGIMVYDITDPKNPTFVQYELNRDFSKDVKSKEAGDLGPEGLCFVSAADSPSGKPLVIVGSEVSGTTTVYEIEKINNTP